MKKGRVAPLKVPPSLKKQLEEAMGRIEELKRLVSEREERINELFEENEELKRQAKKKGKK